MNANLDKEKKSTWVRIINAVDSPVTLFALAVLVSDAVFAIIGTYYHNEEIMIFSMHMFLAILAAFVLVSVWKPMVLYHPRYWHQSKELQNTDKMGSWVITVVLIISMLVYMSYRYIIDSRDDAMIPTYIGRPDTPIAIAGADFKMDYCKKTSKHLICMLNITVPSDMTSLRVIGLPIDVRSIYASEIKLKDKKLIIDDRPVSKRMELGIGKPNELTFVFYLSEVHTLSRDTIDIPVGFDIGEGEFHIEFRNIQISNIK